MKDLSVGKMRRKLALSGGRTSAYMLRKVMDEYGASFDREFIITFCNTGKEFDATLDFVRDIQRNWGVEIVWLEYTRIPASELDPFVYPHPKSQKTVQEQIEKGLTTHWFKIVTYETARRNGQHGPFDELLEWVNVLPNVRTRICSVQMKVRTMMRYLFSLGIYKWYDYIGIRADESHRALEIRANCPKYIIPKFPLIDHPTSESDVLSFWSKQSFDLQLKPYEGNCDLCYLKARHKRVRLAKEKPFLVPWWSGWESRFAGKPEITGDGKYFRKGQSYAGLLAEAQQPSLFEDDDIPCGCGDKGFVIASNEESNLEA